jgi:two-component system sensor histidine kinase ChiS
MAAPVIVVIEDDPVVLELMADVLLDAGYQPELWASPDGALELIRRTRPALVILDAWLARKGDGWTILDEMSRASELNMIPVIMASADDQVRRHMDGRKAAHYVAIEKPFELHTLLATIRRLLDPDGDPLEASVGPRAGKPG